jgi:hypothetical protein
MHTVVAESVDTHTSVSVVNATVHPVALHVNETTEKPRGRRTTTPTIVTSSTHKTTTSTTTTTESVLVTCQTTNKNGKLITFYANDVFRHYSDVDGRCSSWCDCDMQSQAHCHSLRCLFEVAPTSQEVACQAPVDKIRSFARTHCTHKICAQNSAAPCTCVRVARACASSISRLCANARKSFPILSIHLLGQTVVCGRAHKRSRTHMCRHICARRIFQVRNRLFARPNTGANAKAIRLRSRSECRGTRH